MHKRLQELFGTLQAGELDSRSAAEIQLYLYLEYKLRPVNMAGYDRPEDWYLECLPPDLMKIELADNLLERIVENIEEALDKYPNSPNLVLALRLVGSKLGIGPLLKFVGRHWRELDEDSASKVHMSFQSLFPGASGSEEASVLIHDSHFRDFTAKCLSSSSYSLRIEAQNTQLLLDRPDAEKADADKVSG